MIIHEFYGQKNRGGNSSRPDFSFLVLKISSAASIRGGPDRCSANRQDSWDLSIWPNPTSWSNWERSTAEPKSMGHSDPWMEFAAGCQETASVSDDLNHHPSSYRRWCRFLDPSSCRSDRAFGWLFCAAGSAYSTLPEKAGDSRAGRADL